MRSGADMVRLAGKHVGEEYVLGALVDYLRFGCTGPWDCSRFASWCTYQATSILYGTEPKDNPSRAEAYTGYWGEQAKADNAIVDVNQAASTAGAFVLRLPTVEKTGHIVISDGAGGTIEAHSKNSGVIRSILSYRRWDMGILVPGVEYSENHPQIIVVMPDDILRLTSPVMRSPLVSAVQEKLRQLGFHPGKVDGIYGPQTAAAVRDFQEKKGLLPDGEVGDKTLSALGITNK